MKLLSVLAGAALLAMTALAPGRAKAASEATAPPSSLELVQPARFGQIAISPNGRYLALVRRAGRRDSLTIVDIAAKKQTAISMSPQATSFDISTLAWKGDDRIVVVWRGYTVKMGEDGAPRLRKSGGETQEMVDRWGRGIASVDRVGGVATDLGQGSLSDTLPGDPTRVLIRAYDKQQLSLFSVDVKTGERRLIDRGIATTVDWDVDATGQLAIRYDVYGRRGGLRVMGRDAQGKWMESFSIRPRDFEAMADIAILGATGQPGKFYVAVKPKETTGARTRELRIYDFVNRIMGEKLWSHPVYDFDSIVLDGPAKRLAAICYWADTYSCDYLDATEAREFKALDRFFANDRSLAVIGSSEDESLRLLRVRGPDEPGSYYLYNRKTQKVDLLGSGYPLLKPARLGPVSRYSFKASDGLQISGYLTSPMTRAGPGAGKPPLLVMPHGGPEVRDHYGFDAWAQAFATRGYVVYQPNFRGSGGFGATFAEQGYGQWGLRMQDDVIEGVKDLIAKGLVDPDRICILGASYGGYVALQAGARNPDLFKCVISQAGVSDLPAMMKWEKIYFDEDSLQYRYWLKSIGDPSTDSARLKATSPTTYAKTYGPPVLLLHGDQDWTVPLQQSQIMEKALKAAGRPVELVIYRNEGHGGWETDNQVDALDRMLAFVEKAIGRKTP